MNPEKSRQICEQPDYKAIDGWFSDEAALLFAWMDDIHRTENIIGNIFEVGCHHGKSTVFLSSMLRNEEILSVCDVFDNQELNPSISGSGDYKIFQNNMASVGVDGVQKRMKVFQQRSDSLKIEDIGDRFRFFHIDGGHNCDEALYDLKLASQATIENGAIVLDDPFRPEWPGVTEALIRFLDECNQFRAIIVGFNKLVLVRRDHIDLYLQGIRPDGICRAPALDRNQVFKLDSGWYKKQLPFIGRALLIYYQ